MEHNLQKGSNGMHVAYSNKGFSNNLHGKNFAYRELDGMPCLRIDMSGNLHVRNKRENRYEDALEFVKYHTIVEWIELHAPEVLKKFIRLARANPKVWILEMDFAEKGDFLYSLTGFKYDKGVGKFRVRLKGTPESIA